MHPFLSDIRSLFPHSCGKTLPLHEPVFGGNEKAYIGDCIDSTFVSSVGEYVNKFEDHIRNISGASYAVAVVNGTCGLHLSLAAAGVDAGSEVITQPLTFVATSNAISHTGAQPIFLDVDEETLGLCPHELRNFLKNNTKTVDGELINNKTSRPIKACMPVHILGHPCKIDEISAICNEFGLPIIEDAAEGLGSLYKDKMVGTFGKAGVYSFNGNKITTCGGGGVIVTDDEEMAVRLKHISTTAKVAHPYEFSHDDVAFNYRLTNLSAALGCAQLEQLDSYLKIKQELAHTYRDLAQQYDDFTLIEQPENCQSNHWLNAIRFKNFEARTAFLNNAMDAKIQCRAIWKLMTDLPMYKNCAPYNMPNAKALYETVVKIPSSVNWNTP